MKSKLWTLVAGSALVTGSATALLSGCGGGGSGSSARTLLGTPVSVGSGRARSFVRVNGNGTPATVGVMLDQAALDSLSAPAQNMTNATHAEETELSFPLPLPVGAPKTLVDHVALDWNPSGHPPQGIYSNPHFDVHFYTITPQEQAAITPDKLATADTPAPEARFVPQDYVTGREGVPFQGVHYIDPTSPEFNPPHLFDKTFIYGFYKGQQSFFEPMVSADFLKTHPNLTVPVKQPAAYQKSGYFPSTYSIKYNASSHDYTIALGMTAR